MLLTAAVLAATSCAAPAPSVHGTNPDTATRSDEPAYGDRGPFGMGVTTIHLSDRPMEVWYPTEPSAGDGAKRDSYHVREFVSGRLDKLIPTDFDPTFLTDAVREAPASPNGPFPVVFFAHGFASFRQQSSFLTTHLASWGFVVLAPDFLDRGLKAVLGDPPAHAHSDEYVVDEAIRALRSANADSGLLHGLADTSSIYPVGHSAGGGTVLQMLERPDVPSGILLASNFLIGVATTGSLILDTHKPLMWLGGRSDHIVDISGVRDGFRKSTGERKLIEFNGAGHLNAFSDICEIGDGGIVALARAAKLPIPEFLLQLGNDGCPTPKYRPSAELWPAVRHFVTAELRYRSGEDPQPVGLGSGVIAKLDDVAVYKHTP